MAILYARPHRLFPITMQNFSRWDISLREISFPRRFFTSLCFSDNFTSFVQKSYYGLYNSLESISLTSSKIFWLLISVLSGPLWTFQNRFPRRSIIGMCFALFSQEGDAPVVAVILVVDFHFPVSHFSDNGFRDKRYAPGVVSLCYFLLKVVMPSLSTTRFSLNTINSLPRELVLDCPRFLASALKLPTTTRLPWISRKASTSFCNSELKGFFCDCVWDSSSHTLCHHVSSTRNRFRLRVRRLNQYYGLESLILPTQIMPQ